jgi:7-cyano-7-deazaguanine reductase
VSWLNIRGKPQVALAHFTVPCESLNIIESKSFKLYLNSFNNTRFADLEAVKGRLRLDVSEAVWRDAARDASGTGFTPPSIGVKLLTPELFDREPIHELDGLSLDRLDVECSRYMPAPELLRVAPHEAPVTEVLTSNLLKSNCLVTGQPDWGSVRISYSGVPIDQEGLLQYLVSFRNHNEFHEQCVERIFMDIWTRCKPSRLSVYARYTRRGGVDINPFRTSYAQALPPNTRTARQ